jgi:hypothetical protein
MLTRNEEAPMYILHQPNGIVDRLAAKSMLMLIAMVAISAFALAPANVVAAQGVGGARGEPQGRWMDLVWDDDWQAPAEHRASENTAAQASALHEPLDYELRRVAREIADMRQEPDFAPVASVPSVGSPLGVLPPEFRIMGFLSVALSIIGIAIVVRYRPALRGLRGRNDSADARRKLIRCVAILTAINLADLAFTAFLAPMQEFVELNPVADLLRACMPALVAGKLLLVGACAAAFVVFWRYRIVQFASWCAATTYVGLAIWWVAYFNAARS